ncbi:hypothetical protein LTS10_012494 [Elasticomyces elasticus]|nr:hypothetical protein LTS10_012494 [Elasticomyces elasticus]
MAKRSNAAAMRRMSTQSQANTKTSSTKNGMVDSLLSTLNSEMRNLIYKFALQQPEPITVRYCEDEDDQSNSLASTSVDKYPTALTETCKSIRDECGTTFYAINQFHFDGRTDSLPKTNIVKQFLASIGGSNSRAMRSVTIDTGSYHSILAYFLMHALQETVRFSRIHPYIKFQCLASICPDRLAAHGINYRLVLECSDIPASFQKLAVEVEAALRSLEAATVSPQHWGLLKELKDAPQVWEALVNTVKAAGMETTGTETGTATRKA